MRLHMGIIRFIADEVRRQGFKGETHLERCIYMAFAWDWAERRSKLHEKPNIYDVVKLGKLVEPHQNSQGFRHVGVRVGEWMAPRAIEVPGLMQAWVERLIPSVEPDLAYKEFEEIHPFMDGNGRVGKILHNWLRGSLGDPVLVKDFFGHGVP